jgi:hypothetical protein
VNKNQVIDRSMLRSKGKGNFFFRTCSFNDFLDVQPDKIFKVKHIRRPTWPLSIPVAARFALAFV